MSPGVSISCCRGVPLRTKAASTCKSWGSVLVEVNKNGVLTATVGSVMLDLAYLVFQSQETMNFWKYQKQTLHLFLPTRYRRGLTTARWYCLWQQLGVRFPAQSWGKGSFCRKCCHPGHRRNLDTGINAPSIEGLSLNRAYFSTREGEYCHPSLLHKKLQRRTITFQGCFSLLGESCHFTEWALVLRGNKAVAV